MRLNVLEKKSEKKKYFFRLYMDRGLKIKAFRTYFLYCDKVIINDVDKSNLINSFEEYINGNNHSQLDSSVIENDISNMMSIFKEED